MQQRYPNVAELAPSAAWIALPLRVGARVIGALGIAFSRQQTWDDAQRLYLLTLADLCAIVLDRELLAERRAEARYRSLVEAANTIVWTADAMGRFVEPVDTWLAYTGQSASEAHAHGWLDAIHDADRGEVFQALDDARSSRPVVGGAGPRAPRRVGHIPAHGRTRGAIAR